MPRTSFGTGTPITADFLNAVSYPKITGLANDGHLDLLTNSNFLNSPGTVVFDYYERVNRLQSSRFAVSGLTLTVNGCNILGPLGDTIAVATQTVNVPDNSISWVWVNDTGVLQVTSFNPPSGVRSARVTSGSGTITQIVDLRYDYLWIPNPATLAVFGGNSTVDYTAPVGTTVLSGVLNCRNFTVPVGAIIEVDRTLTVRASGVTSIAGQIRTRTTPVVFQGFTVPTIGHDQGQSSVVTGTQVADFAGVPVTNRNKPASFGGSSFSTFSASTSFINRGTACVFNVVATNIAISAGVSGAVLTINSAGPVTLTGTAIINCSATSTTTPTVTNSPFSLSAIGGSATENWTAQLQIIAPQSTAGTFVLQSSTSIVIAAGANISANGANKVAGLTYSLSTVGGSVGSPVTSGWFFVGGGGGGAIHFQAPSVSSSPSATISSIAGSHVIVGGENYINGLGSGGNGFNATTNALPTNGPITTVLSAPIEF